MRRLELVFPRVYDEAEPSFDHYRRHELSLGCKVSHGDTSEQAWFSLLHSHSHSHSLEPFCWRHYPCRTACGSLRRSHSGSGLGSPMWYNSCIGLSPWLPFAFAVQVVVVSRYAPGSCFFSGRTPCGPLALSLRLLLSPRVFRWEFGFSAASRLYSWSELSHFCDWVACASFSSLH